MKEEYKDKTKEQLINDLVELRQQIAELEKEKIERKRAEEERNKLLKAIETTKEAINITTPDTVMIYTNDAMDELFGYKKGELIGKQVSILNAGPAQEAKEVPKPIVDAIKKKGVWEGEIHNKRKDGTEFTSLAIITALTDKNGKIINYISTQHDITERKRAEEALRSSEERLKILFDFAPDAYYLNDLKGTFVDGNKAAEKITGYKRSELMGKSFLKLKLLSPKQIPKAAKLLAQNVLGKPTGPDEFTFIRKDGSRIALEISTVPMKIKGQTLVLGIARNITERKRAEEERERLLKELDAKTTEMERFTYTISHDLRSPLVTVQGFVEMLREDFGQNEREKVESDLKFIENGTTKMEHLLNDTLQLSRIGRMVNPPEDVSFGKIVQEAQVQTAQQIKSSGVEITVAEDFPAVHVDRMRIAEMLVNLITNSMNYMGEQPSPKIDIGYRVDEEETVFFVQDNGIGIDKSQHEKVFKLFYTVDKSSKGTGAGLAIVKRIIEVHNGRIWIESEKGKGCTVCFTLPLYNYEHEQ